MIEFKCDWVALWYRLYGFITGRYYAYLVPFFYNPLFDDNKVVLRIEFDFEGVPYTTRRNGCAFYERDYHNGKFIPINYDPADYYFGATK